MTTGLVLGKFAPLHKGHQFLIETACAENNYVIVIVYDAPDVTSIPLPVRAGWIRALYPDVRVIQAWDGPLEVGDSPEVTKAHDDYLLAILGGETITAFYSSEFYGHHVSRALQAEDRRVDPNRERFPISGTEIRRNAYANREYLDALVYRDLITKVVFLGAPSTGKTTLARELATACKTVWMPEYGREYWERNQYGRRLTLEQLLEIAEVHREREDRLISAADRLFFVDTDATTTAIFSLHYHGEALPGLQKLAAETIDRYDLFFLCDTDIPYEDSWDRSGDADRLLMQHMITADLISRRIPFITLRGSLESRMKTVFETLDGFLGFPAPLMPIKNL